MPKTMTPAAVAFIERFSIVERMIAAGTPMFAALAAGLEDDDWLLVYAAIRTLVGDLKADDRNVRSNLGLPAREYGLQRE